MPGRRMTSGIDEVDSAGRSEFGIFVGPIAASLAIATLLSKILPRASGPLTAVLWVVIVAFGSLLTLVIFERAARRFLPLAALLNISLLFPDKAPARFAVARRTGTPRQLQEQLAKARAAGQQDNARGMQTVVELVLALSVHDEGTRGHSERVRVFADLIADELKIDRAGQARLRWAALLHDVGKLEVPKKLLNKPGRPDDEEWKVLHRHPEEGARLVAPLIPWLGEWGRAVVEHHERYDGTGYPHRLKAQEISLAARIVAVADTYEVMTAPRPYKRSMSIAMARQELIQVSGTQLDPAIVRAFLNISVGRLWRTIGFGAWIGQVPAVGRLLERARQHRLLGRHRCLDRHGGGGHRSRWAGQPLAERHGTAELRRTIGADDVGIESAFRRIECHARSIGVPQSLVDAGAVVLNTDRARWRSLGWCIAATWRDPDIKHAADDDSHADPLTNPDAGSMELRVVHRYVAELHELLHQQQSLPLPDVLRRQQQRGLHIALLREQQPVLSHLLRRPEQPEVRV